MNIENDKVLCLANDILDLKISDAVKLIDALCEKLGISKEALCAAPSGGSSSGGSGADESAAVQTEFCVLLKEVGDKKLEVIKKVKELLGCGLKEAKDFVDAAPKVIKEKISKDEAEALMKALAESGASCEIK
jgi:large subunit ribosomal protein L7/L12